MAGHPGEVVARRHPRHRHPNLGGAHVECRAAGAESLDAELPETDDAGRPRQVGKVALAAVVGNEYGAHKIVAVRRAGTLTLAVSGSAGRSAHGR